MKKTRLGVMLDCSRNGVMKVETVKKYIDTIIITDIGFAILNFFLVITNAPIDVIRRFNTVPKIRIVIVFI